MAVVGGSLSFTASKTLLSPTTDFGDGRTIELADVTEILQSIEDGNPQASADLLPLVYEELRRLATARMAAERPGQTLQATALVHEAFLRLVANQVSPTGFVRRHNI